MTSCYWPVTVCNDLIDLWCCDDLTLLMCDSDDLTLVTCNIVMTRLICDAVMTWPYWCDSDDLTLLTCNTVMTRPDLWCCDDPDLIDLQHCDDLTLSTRPYWQCGDLTLLTSDDLTLLTWPYWLAGPVHPHTDWGIQPVPCWSRCWCGSRAPWHTAANHQSGPVWVRDGVLAGKMKHIKNTIIYQVL